ncbi:polyprenyl synthetase family protein [Streptomyces sp. NPDC086989]|uniref:polyprenyl synthetase family protein n=1 Tax=Streptomyces sp. NPDC086989 TaxID=3365764 RepID=UPI0038245DB1
MIELPSQRAVPIPAQSGVQGARGSSGNPIEILDALEAEFARRWPNGVTGLDEVHRYAMIPPGKLLRPLLVVHAALTVGGELSSVLPAAAGIEGVHVGSLMHDDIIDRDTQRRGRAAVHAAFGRAQAIVAGNALYFSWFAALAECAERGVPTDRIGRALEVQAGAGVTICRGAFDELAMRGGLDLSVDDYLAIARGKTAALLQAACRIGSILGGGDIPATDLLGAFGDHLGIAFQIRDDLLPYAPATAGLAGKPADSDLRNHCPTLPVLLAHQRADPAGRAALRHTLLNEADPRTALRRMRALLDETGALEAAHAMADHHAQLARDAISQLPATAHTHVLALLTLPPSETTRQAPA